MASFNELDNSLLDRILRHLAATDIVKCSLLCKRIHEFILDNAHIQLILHKKYYHYPRYLDQSTKPPNDQIAEIVRLNKNLQELKCTVKPYKIPKGHEVYKIWDDYVVTRPGLEAPYGYFEKHGKFLACSIFRGAARMDILCSRDPTFAVFKIDFIHRVIILQQSCGTKAAAKFLVYRVNEQAPSGTERISKEDPDCTIVIDLEEDIWTREEFGPRILKNGNLLVGVQIVFYLYVLVHGRCLKRIPSHQGTRWFRYHEWMLTSNELLVGVEDCDFVCRRSFTDEHRRSFDTADDAKLVGAYFRRDDVSSDGLSSESGYESGDDIDAGKRKAHAEDRHAEEVNSGLSHENIYSSRFDRTQGEPLDITGYQLFEDLDYTVRYQFERHIIRDRLKSKGLLENLSLIVLDPQSIPEKDPSTGESWLPVVKLELPFDPLELEILLKECRYEGNPDFYEYIDDSKRVMQEEENFDTGCTDFVLPVIRRWIPNDNDYARDPLTIIDFLIAIPANPLKRLLTDTKGQILVGRPAADSRKRNTFTDLDGEGKERLRQETFQNVTTIPFSDWRENAQLWVQDNDPAMAQHGNFNVDIIANGKESLILRAHCISPLLNVPDLDEGCGKGSMRRLQIPKPVRSSVNSFIFAQ
ncbi:hypothetical protein L486_00488 [Kwoniella mangroviensis CBS 10435]|uniref:F-box domain-containing protein n=1 Tax=Kwoniella mangroviensis CBS 10435 TaxID=1331196 RepID=A0A1B9IZ80_9TREE|nr:hypothetical protein L486_00488 [Kwoniella mangroviensis CBS 10435]